MDNTRTIINRYNRTAMFYDYMDFMISDGTRRKITGLATGKVLEVGVGTGKNLPFYTSDCQVTGIDFSPKMLEKAQQRAQSLSNVTLMEMDIQQLDFPDNTFDSVLATCVFCSVPNPLQGLQELRRVCKPTGQLIFVEHVRSANAVLGLLMDVLNPVVLRLIGANINRQTLQTMEQAGLSLTTVDNLGMEILKIIQSSPNKAAY